ncbi:YybH family protein [Sphingomonas sp. ASY06-1R]|jgi:ketosteroid isomerase-like protein|uniref:YybH family protein n=1 Tax=Sphingomonas sp. ASY06-1R TaxID=3445771 RepID=UPI003FA2DC54
MTTPADLEIRMRRAAFNAALARGDLNAIQDILAPTAILVTGTDSALLSGRKAQLLAWKQEFAAADRTIYVRTPTAITVSPVEPIAFEQGDWKGVSAGGDVVRTTGTYTAKWRRLGQGWVIEAELYLTLG